MAVRSSVFENGFRFNENIGPNGSDPDYPMGSETEFCCRVAQSGVKAWFAKEPRVQHIVRSNQLTSSYWAKRAYRHGRGVARRMWESDQPAPGVFTSSHNGSAICFAAPRSDVCSISTTTVQQHLGLSLETRFSRRTSQKAILDTFLNSSAPRQTIAG